MLVVALIPQFIFANAWVSNDSLATLAATAALYWVVRLLKAEDVGASRWAKWVVLGILMGLATLSKLQGAALLALAGVVIAWIAWRRRSPRTVFVAVPLVLAPALAIAGWWFVRNRVLYGDWLGTSVLVGVSGLRNPCRASANCLAS